MAMRFGCFPVALGLLPVLAGCGGMTPVPQKGAERVWSTHEQRPDWTRETEVVTGEEQPWFFVGRSMRHATERGAIDAARREAVASAVKALRRDVVLRERERLGGTTPDREVQSRKVTTRKDRLIRARGDIGPLPVADAYVTAYDGDRAGRFYRAFVRVRVSPGARKLYRRTFSVPPGAGEAGSSGTGGMGR